MINFNDVASPLDIIGGSAGLVGIFVALVIIVIAAVALIVIHKRKKNKEC